MIDFIVNYTSEQLTAMREPVLPQLFMPITAGIKMVVVGHDDSFEAVPGICPEPQRVAFGLRQINAAVEELGRIAPNAWPTT